MTVVQALAPRALAPAALPAEAYIPRLRSLTPHLLLVANGNASGLSRRPQLVEDSARLLRFAGARVETRVTTTLEELDDALATAERRVVLLGGDGSLHAAANARDGAGTELALIPGGRANNIARSLGIPLDPTAAARLAVEGSARPLDAVVALTPSARYAGVEGISVGFHALARSNYHGANSADVGAAVRSGVGALARFRPITVSLSVDGAAEIATISQLFVANMPLYGPGLRVAPGADPADGLLEVVVIGGRSRASLLSLVPHLRRGTHVGRPGVRVLRARSIRIATGGRSPVIADTTNLGTGPVDLSVERHALHVVGGRAA
jgi:diacylglycerol kinase (ATP)